MAINFNSYVFNRQNILACIYNHFYFFRHSECGCSKEGSVKDSCDDVTGKCRCVPGFNGNKCEICPSGKVLDLDANGYSEETCQPEGQPGI